MGMTDAYAKASEGVGGLRYVPIINGPVIITEAIVSIGGQMYYVGGQLAQGNIGTAAKAQGVYLIAGPVSILQQATNPLGLFGSPFDPLADTIAGWDPGSAMAGSKAAAGIQEAVLLVAMASQLPVKGAPTRTPMQWTIPIKEGGAINAVGRAGAIEIEVIANMRRVGDTVFLEGVHFTRNAGGRLGPAQLQEFGRDFLRQHGNGASRLVIQPGVRTTGASVGPMGIGGGFAPPPITITLD
jgi:hypothetical protein